MSSIVLPPEPLEPSVITTPPPVTTLLPPNSTATELAMDRLIAHRLDIDLDPVTTDPNTCPEQLLPWLAAAWRIDTAGLTVYEQRITIAHAVRIHRHSGTVYAVQQALNAVFKNARIQFTQPFWFDAVVTFGANTHAVYDAAKFATARKLVDAAKNLGSRFGNFTLELPEASGNINQASHTVFKPALNNSLTLTAQTNINVTGYVQWIL